MRICLLDQRSLDPVGGRLLHCRTKRKMQCRRRLDQNPGSTVTGMHL